MKNIKTIGLFTILCTFSLINGMLSESKSFEETAKILEISPLNQVIFLNDLSDNYKDSRNYHVIKEAFDKQIEQIIKKNPEVKDQYLRYKTPNDSFVTNQIFKNIVFGTFITTLAGVSYYVWLDYLKEQENIKKEAEEKEKQEKNNDQIQR